MTTSESTESEVRTAAGTVRGRREDGLSVFRGIPFAEPPVGDARFAAPRPVRGWEGVREAFSFGPPPPQDLSVAGRTGELPGVPMGDEWLTVNVWTPDPDPSAHRPVMVWIYGGAYKLGFSGSPGYDAQRIAREGGVVVVSLNYRVGIEGFAAVARGGVAHGWAADGSPAVTTAPGLRAVRRLRVLRPAGALRPGRRVPGKGAAAAAPRARPGVRCGRVPVPGRNGPRRRRTGAGSARG